MQVLPRTRVPRLAVPRVGGGVLNLAEVQPKHFTLLVFYRGRH